MRCYKEYQSYKNMILYGVSLLKIKPGTMGATALYQCDDIRLICKTFKKLISPTLFLLDYFIN